VTESQPPPTPTDQLIGRVINLVGLIAVLALAGIVTLAVLGRPMPDVLQNLAVASLTGLTALLVGRRQA
jgi:hypothetical protein